MRKILITGYPCTVGSCVIRHCVRECMPVNVPSKFTCVISLLLTDNKGAMTFQSVPSYFPPAILVIATLLSVRRGNNTNTLAGNIDRHAFPHTMVNHKWKIFRPVRPAGLGFQARPGQRAARPVAIISTLSTFCITSVILYSVYSKCQRTQEAASGTSFSMVREPSAPSCTRWTFGSEARLVAVENICA